MTVTDRGPDLDAARAALRRDGVAVVPGVLDADRTADALDRLWDASSESTRRGVPTHIPGLDPNAANVRVFNLIDLDPLFAELIAHPVADTLVTELLGSDYVVSNFTANIARPGSESMVAHSDLAAVLPEPWVAPHSINIIWCLTDVRADNGATLHLPGSQRFERLSDVPPDVVDRMVPLAAPAGSIIAMEGRIWHTSGRNVTADEDRALLFGYYTKPYLRPQWNFTRSLRPQVQDGMSPLMRYRLGLDATLNMGFNDTFGGS